MFFCVAIAMICEAVRWRGSIEKLGAGLKAFLMSMGKAMSGVVALVIAAGIFAEGFKALGMVDAIVNLSSAVGAGAVGHDPRDALLLRQAFHVRSFPGAHHAALLRSPG